MSNITLSFGYYVERPYGRFADTHDGSIARKRILKFTKKLLEFLDDKQAPRTLFILGEYLEKCRAEYPPHELKKIYNPDNPLNEIQQHSYSHVAIRDIESDGKKAVPCDEFLNDVANANSSICDILNVVPHGIGMPYGYSRDMSDATEFLDALNALGIRYVSSDLRGETSLDAPLTKRRQPHSYAQVDHPKIIEIPSHGFQDVVFTEEKRGRFGAKHYDQEDIIAHYTGLFDVAEKMRTETQHPVSIALCLHPWAIMEYDPELDLHGVLIDTAKYRGIEIVSYGAIADNVRARQNITI